MKIFSRNILYILLVSLSAFMPLVRRDEDPPESPVFTFVTINETTRHGQK